MTLIDKEAQREKILSSNSSHVLDEDFSMFGDNDPEVFEKLVSFDSYQNKQNNIYPKLSDFLKNKKKIFVQAAKCSPNIPFIPQYFFQDTDVIKSIIYNRLEKLIPIEHLTKNVVNYMYTTCSRSSLATEEIKKACDQHLTKDSIIKVLLHQTNFYSEAKKKHAVPCIDDIYIPQHFFNDKDILQLLIIPQFKLIKDNDNITKEMILELIESGYILNTLPVKFFDDIELIKKCLKYEHNCSFMDDYSIKCYNCL